MHPLSVSVAVVSAFLIVCSLPLHADGPVKVQGVTSVTRLFRAAAGPLRERGIEIKIADECSNGQAAAALGGGEIDLALLSRELTAEERASYPDRNFHEVRVGTQTLALLVSRSIWDSGVHALKRQQVEDLYEGKVHSWKQFGGEDRSTKFFEPAHGHGVWEIFANWLYEDFRKAPAVRWEVVADGREAQTAVQFQSGSIAVAPVQWADRRDVFPLAIIDETGTPIEPTAENAAHGKYPLSRPAFVAASERPTGDKRKILEFLASEKGQALAAENDLLPVPRPKNP